MLILKYVRRHLGIFLLSMFFLALEATADLLQPAFMAHIVNEGVKGVDLTRVFYYGAVMLGIAAVGAFCAVMRSLFASRTSQTIAKELRSDLFRKVQTLSFENIDRLQPASIITRITNDVTQIQEFVNSSMRIMIKGPMTCIGAVFLIAVQTPRQIPVIAAILCIVSILVRANMKTGFPRFSRLQKKLDRLNTVSREFLTSIRVVKAFNAEDEEQQKFCGASSELADAGKSAMRTMAVFAPLINLTVNIGIVVLLWLSQSQHSRGIGQVMASVNYMTQILFALGRVTVILNTAVRALASSGRIGTVFAEIPAQKVAEVPLRPHLKGAISFDNVSFAYAGSGRAALSGVSFSIQPGETIGIIGPTGSGKTTLVNLVPRFYDASVGRVLIDGIDVTRLDEKTLHSAVAIVPQRAVLFSGTIGQNLRWGKDNASEADIRAALQLACAEDFVNISQNGLDTLLGQSGVNLSGGQKQRIALARALLRCPAVLILDDCTSALDAGTESVVLNRIRGLQDTTVLLISQRISTVRRADHILCLENGLTRGWGTHEDLMAGCQVYRAIYESQIGGVSDAR